MRAAPRWERYARCGVCWREWDCRQVRRQPSRFVSLGWAVLRVGLGASWGDRSLKRPHRGRQRRGGA